LLWSCVCGVRTAGGHPAQRQRAGGFTAPTFRTRTTSRRSRRTARSAPTWSSAARGENAQTPTRCGRLSGLGDPLDPPASSSTMQLAPPAEEGPAACRGCGAPVASRNRPPNVPSLRLTRLLRAPVPRFRERTQEPHVLRLHCMRGSSGDYRGEATGGPLVEHSGSAARAENARNPTERKDERPAGERRAVHGEIQRARDELG
jgi:hypothetical protein